MASTSKTPNLRLNSWNETDCPKRSDFVSDNVIIDNLVGNHIKDLSLHLTAEEKERASKPFEIFTIYGTGEDLAEVKLSYTPKLVFWFMKNAPFNKHQENYTLVNASVASSIGTTGGVRIYEYKVTAQQNTQAENGMLFNLNNEDEEYIMVAFR